MQCTLHRHIYSETLKVLLVGDLSVGNIIYSEICLTWTRLMDLTQSDTSKSLRHGRFLNLCTCKREKVLTSTTSIEFVHWFG